MTPAVRQLGALLALRWQMLRSSSSQLGLVLSGVLVAWLLHAAAVGGGGLDAVSAATVVEVAPAAFLGFGVLALIAPLTAGGGQDVVPPDQLVGYPVRPWAQFAGGLLLAPLNLVWLIQLLVLTGVTAAVAAPGRLLPAATTTALWVSSVTLLGQDVAWTVAGARATAAGRRAMRTAVLVLAALVVAVAVSDAGTWLLRASPAQEVVRAAAAGSRGDLSGWLPTAAVLAVTTAALLVVGARACAWAVRRPVSGALAEASDRRRRAARSGSLRQLVAVDRASVWRAAPLRRGGLVLAVLPGLLAMTAELPWQSLVVLPALVAAGAGLLFGVNAFCLDSSGAVWLASLPQPTWLMARAKALVLAETVLGAVVLSTALAALSAPAAPTATELTGALTSALASTAVVVAVCLRSSVRRPHRADLRGPRDAVVPPGALAAASVRLAVPASLTGTLVAVAAQTQVWWFPPLVGLPAVLLAALSLLRTARRYGDPQVRARVVLTVATG